MIIEYEPREEIPSLSGVSTVHEAVAASYGLNPGAYREAVRT